VQLEQKDGDISILELNVTLPEAEESKSFVILSPR
jgi:cell division topological specificity factor